MVQKTHIDLAIIGAGPAGLAAAVQAKRLGLKDLVVFDRDEKPGGILRQCIHPGFGLEMFKEELTGPEYAHRYLKMAQAEGVDFALDTTVLEMDQNRVLTVVSAQAGLRQYECGSIILAMGCRERPRGAIGIPGTRPAGIFTAGQAQRLINIEGYMPGRTVVVLGSGDIGLIMARRLTLEGAQVKAVAEILPHPSGLVRNVFQCLHDFDIPLRLGHTVAEVHGDRRVEGVTLVRVDERWNPMPGTEQRIECDTLLLSVGLIPENELSRSAGVAMDSRTGGACVNDYFETSLQGVFSCGNVLHVNDVVDNVSSEGESAAYGAYLRVKGRMPDRMSMVPIEADETIGQIVPHRVSGQNDTTLHLRVKRPMKKVTLRVGDGFEKKLPYARPSEMIWVTVPKEVFRAASGPVMVRCEGR
ncbi:MAG: NAD(P)/FAD-dependent oxidoreductase [Desulfobacterota bacterium]|jgi:NADPH-dependent 2,4-dienoyl-CoA reductase/sulfur reductase-like enzyme|nr:NAD(P)/FAD-dependent oxidoreductase [Thermodesulfobacteriota bacterium]